MPASSYVSRINQLDAIQLDSEIYEIFRSQVKNVTKLFTTSRIEKYQPELDLVIKLLLWHYSLRIGSSTFGQQLLNLKYENLNKKKSFLYLVLTTIPKYVQERVLESHYVTINNTSNRVKSYLGWIVKMIGILEFLNLLLFLHRGTRPHLMEHLLGIFSQPTLTQRSRSIGYSYMTRELLWHGLIELFTIGLPIINFICIRQKWKQFWSKMNNQIISKSHPRMRGTTNCSYCHQKLILPQSAGCKHLFCYYCLQAHFIATDTFPCPECGSDLYFTAMGTYVE